MEGVKAGTLVLEGVCPPTESANVPAFTPCVVAGRGIERGVPDQAARAS
jgi:hypothetical protein